MDYKKAYKDALERASKLRVQNPFDTVSQMMEYVFPELKESEDEKIRKWLIDTIKQVPNDSIEWETIDKSSVLAWLEKQCEPKSYWKPTKEQYEALDYAYNSCSDTERGNYYEGVLETLIEDLHRLEKQGGQKPTDKVEPIVVRDFDSVFSREQVEEIDKRIEESQRLYNAKLMDAMRKVEDLPMTD